MLDSPVALFRRLNLGRKFVLAFGFLMLLLGLSLAAILFYLARINSYVERHNRITIPAVVTAADMRQTAFEMHLALHTLQRTHVVDQRQQIIDRLQTGESHIREALAFYARTHAARTHPVLFRMLTDHGQVGLADEEERLLAEARALVNQLSARHGRIRNILDQPKAVPAALFQESGRLYDRLAQTLTDLVQIHTKIDAEMKQEGNLLLGQARLVILALVVFLGIVIGVTYRMVSTQIATPLRRLAGAADRLAHGELTAEFEQWPAQDEVGDLSISLASMLTTLRERSAALERKTRELEAFSYSVAHDLKGPLREIEGFSSLIEQHHAASLDATPQRYLAMIRASALRMTALIDALLKYSRLEQQTLPMTRVNVRTIVDHVVREREIATADRPAALRVELPELDVWGEPTSIHQAIANLVDNALKFTRHMESREITIGGGTGQGEIVLWVRDNGVGFDSQQAGKLFGLFERLHASNEYEGTGVGLAIVKLVMDKHRGRVWAESSPGKGSTFYLAFPQGIPDTK